MEMHNTAARVNDFSRQPLRPVKCENGVDSNIEQLLQQGTTARYANEEMDATVSLPVSLRSSVASSYDYASSRGSPSSRSLGAFSLAESLNSVDGSPGPVIRGPSGSGKSTSKRRSSTHKLRFQSRQMLELNRVMDEERRGLTAKDLNLSVLVDRGGPSLPTSPVIPFGAGMVDGDSGLYHSTSVAIGRNVENVVGSGGLESSLPVSGLQNPTTYHLNRLLSSSPGVSAPSSMPANSNFAQTQAVQMQAATGQGKKPIYATSMPEQKFGGGISIDADGLTGGMSRSRRKKNNHNAIERRRRYNINDRIAELGEIVPPPEEDEAETPQAKAPNKGEKGSKGDILKRSVEYIQSLESRVGELEEVLRKAGISTPEGMKTSKQRDTKALGPAAMEGEPTASSSTDNKGVSNYDSGFIFRRVKQEILDDDDMGVGLSVTRGTTVGIGNGPAKLDAFATSVLTLKPTEHEPPDGPSAVDHLEATMNAIPDLACMADLPNFDVDTFP